MSQENVELVTRSLEHWLDGRIGEWTETLDTDIEWDISGYPLPDFPDSGSGRDALVDHVASYRSGWNDYKPTINELIDGGDDVILILRERARMRGSDITLDRDLAMVWTVRDGRIVLFRVFKSRALALEAAGLRE